MHPRLDITELAADGYRALLRLETSVNGGDLDANLLNLIRLRVSQINGCAFCVDMHAHDLKDAGESDERLWSIAAWRDAPYYTDPERAAFALAEADTRLHDNPSGVTDEVWAEAGRHFSDTQLATLVMAIAAINAWNRINIANRQVAGARRPHAAAASVAG